MYLIIKFRFVSHLISFLKDYFYITVHHFFDLISFKIIIHLFLVFFINHINFGFFRLNYLFLADFITVFINF